jgi:hypothetical protein
VGTGHDGSQDILDRGEPLPKPYVEDAARLDREAESRSRMAGNVRPTLTIRTFPMTTSGGEQTAIEG